MCGIVGKLFFDNERCVGHDEIVAMLRPIAHRGPDGQGVHLDGNLGLGHLRLSIIDLDTGEEPMANEDETVWIVFNGEIYNFVELRHRLIGKGHSFRSKCDAEVILHLYEDLGPECVRELRGMFAFALWDSRRRRLFIARDRVGIKLLYYSQTSASFSFASELKALIVDPAVRREIDPEAVRTFLSFNYIPGEATLFKDVRKLLPGHYLIVEDGGATLSSYWDLRFTQDRWSMPFDEAVEELHSLLKTTVKDHMIADVPVGILLSGGVDSSAVLNLAVQSTEKEIQSFTVGFDGSNNGVVDERPYAKLAAVRFGSKHYETTISADDFWSFLPRYIYHMEEPVCEPPAVALYHVSKLARSHVKVLLSGEGGDEAFGGYPNYPNMMRLDRLGAALGPFARTAGISATLAGRLFGEARVERYGEALGRQLSSHYFSRSSGPTSFFNQTAGTFFTPEFLESTSSVSSTDYITDMLATVKDEPLLHQMLYVDTKTWLPDDLLVKADKMTMANSLELRVPLLDHQILEFAASLPPDYKVRGQETKRILKAAFAKILPSEVLNRRKAGFPVPYERWLRHDFKAQVAELLLSDRAVGRGYFVKSEISRLLENNARSGKQGREIFSLVVLELWHRTFSDSASAPSSRMASAGVVQLA